MNKLLALIIATLTALLVMAFTPSPAQAPTFETVSVDRCEEDEPCWDHETMGNHVRGGGEGDVELGASRFYMFGYAHTGTDSGETTNNWDTSETNRYRERPGARAQTA